MINQLNDTNIALTSVYDMAEACDPLMGILGIDFFCYHKIFPNGKEILLSNDINWVRHALTHNLVLSKDFVEHCTQGTKEKFVSTLWSLDTRLKIVQDFIGICRGSYGITLSGRKNEYFGFCIKNTKDISVINSYINSLDLLERFCLFFVDKMNGLIEKASKDMVLYYPPKAKIISDCTKSFTNKKVSFIKKTPLRKLPLTLHHINEVSLTSKEMEYLMLFIKGLSDQSIADNYGISKGTIETRIENIKNKFCVSTKSELLKVIIENNLEKHLK